MSDWIVDLVGDAGYIGIVLLMTLENVFPPIPSELIMPLAGYMAARGTVTLWGAVASGMLGSVAGALPLYYVGARLGSERLKRLADRHGRWLTVSRADIERAEAWFDRHGAIAVLWCRLIPGIRSLISIPAGIRRMRLFLFVGVTAIGTAMWSALLAWIGYALGSEYQQVEHYVGWLTWVVLGLVIVLYAVRLVRSRRTDRAQTQGSREA